MLNFAIQRISDAGHQTEIASLATASTNFGVFNRVLSHSLLQLAEKVSATLPLLPPTPTLSYASAHLPAHLRA